MSFGSSYDTKERIRQAVDIVDLVGGYLQLRREGRGFKALCPWHDDSRPSLQVNPERQSFKCWVCDIGGDIFSFLMKIEGVEFPEALAMLAERAGVQLDNQPRNPAASDDKRTLYQAMDWAATQYQKLLAKDPGAGARQYLAARGITPEIIARFRLGYSPEPWDWILKAAEATPFSGTVLEKIGLLVRKKNGPGYYDRFRHRVLFPIFDSQGRAVGMGGRVLPGSNSDNVAKYLNSNETALFSKSNLLYGLNHARDAIRKTNTALVMEGYTDVLVAHQCGFENAVAVMGTALGTQHIRLLKRFAERLRIVLVLDGDEAGRKRANAVLQLFVAENADMRVLTLPKEFDPADFLLQRGNEEFQALIDAAPDALTHAEQNLTAGIDLARDVHRASEALEQLLGIVAKAPRLSAETTSDDRLREGKILQRLALDFGMPEERLRERLSQLRRKSPATGGAAVPATAGTKEKQKIESVERELLELLVAAPHILEQLAKSVKPSQIRGTFPREIYTRALELASRGVVAEFGRLLLEFDDAEVKNLLVELDEQARLKPHAEFDARLQDVLAGFQRRTQAEEVRAHTALLKAEQLPEEEALALLLKIHEQVKTRQGISAPTDG